MKHTLYRRFIWGIISCLNAIFLVYYCGLAVNMRLHYDDIHWLYSAQEQNLWEYLNWVWFDRSGRMSVYAMNWIVSTITNSIGYYWFWPLIYMLFGLLLCWIFVRELPIPISGFKKFLVLVLIYNLYILTAVDFAVFYWPCAMQYYMIGPATLALVGYAVRKELQWYQWLFATVVVAIVGLGYEYWTPIALLILFFVGLYYWKNQQWNIKQTWMQPQVRRIVYMAVLLLIGFAITISAPGMYRRVEGGAVDEGMIHPDSLPAMCLAYGKAIWMLLYYQLFYLPYYLVLAIIMMYMGINARSPLSNTKSIMKWISIITACIIAIACVEPAYIYGGFGIQRFYTPLILLLVFYFAAMGYLIGCRNSEKKDAIWPTFLSIIGLICLSVIMIGNIIIDFPISKQYAEAVDARKEYVLKKRDEHYTGTLELEKIECPRSIDVKYVVFSLFGRQTVRPAIYYYSDVEDSSNDYSVFVRKAYHLDFDIIPKKDAGN